MIAPHFEDGTEPMNAGVVTISPDWIEEFTPYLEPGSASFLQRVYAGDLRRYERRLKQYGLDRCARVLDAGCGYGQWSLALALLGVQVTAVDIQPDRLLVLRELAARLKLDNLTIRRAALEDLPFDDGRFDGVFCYGAIYLTPWRQSLKELTRVLASGGLMYLNANGVGYYHYTWDCNPNGGLGHTPARSAGLALTNSWDYETSGRYSGTGPLIVEPGTLVTAVAEAGLTVLRSGVEGTVTHSGDAPLEKPFFPGEYNGRAAVHELLAVKR